MMFEPRWGGSAPRNADKGTSLLDRLYYVRRTSKACLALLMGFASGCSLSHPAPEAVEVGPVIRQALDDAKQDGRLILVSTTSPWCSPCKRFLQDAESCPRLKRAVSVFHRVTLDSMRDEVDCYVLGVEAYPTFFILSPNGELLARWVGYAPPPEEAAEQVVRMLYQAGRSFELSGRARQAGCLYRLTTEAAGDGQLVDVAKTALDRLVEDGYIKPGDPVSWPS